MGRWSARRALGFGMLAALLAVGAVAGSNAAVIWSAREHTFVHQHATIPPRYVAIVLGARVRPDGTPSHALTDRLTAALALYQSGKVRRILVTGDHGASSYNEVRAMARWLHARGVPWEDLFLDHAGFRTLDSMQRAARVFEVRDAIICTQGFHLARSIYLARAAGIDAIGVIAPAQHYSSPPNAHARELVARVGAVVDTLILRRQPALLGPVIPITGESAPTHDHAQLDG